MTCLASLPPPLNGNKLQPSSQSASQTDGQSARFELLPWSGAGAQGAIDLECMQIALNCAQEARQHKEVPIGAALFMNGELLGQGFNQPCSSMDPTSHAEIVAIRQACLQHGNYRLTHATLYVTLQPCLMCLGAILHARIGRVVVGAPDSRYNSDLPKTLEAVKLSEAWHDCRFELGCRAEESKALMQEFFVAKRPDRAHTLMNLRSLSDLPNVNKATITLLNVMGFESGGDFCKLGLSESRLRILQAIQTGLTIEPEQIAILKSLCDFLSGEPVRSWKEYR